MEKLTGSKEIIFLANENISWQSVPTKGHLLFTGLATNHSDLRHNDIIVPVTLFREICFSQNQKNKQSEDATQVQLVYNIFKEIPTFGQISIKYSTHNSLRCHKTQTADWMVRDITYQQNILLSVSPKWGKYICYSLCLYQLSKNVLLDCFVPQCWSVFCQSEFLSYKQYKSSR